MVGSAWTGATASLRPRARCGVVPEGNERPLRSVPGIAVSLWLGAMAFFAFVVAPAAFAALEREGAGRFVAVIFPRYYLAGTLLGVLALGGCVGRGILRGWRAWDWLPLGLVLLMLALTLYAWTVVLPAAHAAGEAMRQAGAVTRSPEAVRFARLHQLSAMLNGVVMIAGVVFVVMEAMRRP